MRGSCFTLNLVDGAKWAELFSHLPQSEQDIYFIYKYYALYENRGEGKATCFVYKDDTGIALYPFLMNRINDLGYNLDKDYYDLQGAYGYNGVVSSNYTPEFIERFYECFNKWCAESNIVVEFTRFHPLLKNERFSSNNLTVIPNRITVSLNLEQDYESIWLNSYSSKNRNMIRKGEKSLDVLVENDLSAFEAFKEVYTKTMRRIGANPYYLFSAEYFRDTFWLLKDNSCIVSAVDPATGVKVSSLILFTYKDFAHYHLSGREDYIVNNSSNNIILDAAIKIAKEKGCRTIHFGGGNSNSTEDSLFKFKSQFSEDVNSFSIGYKVFNPQIYAELLSAWEEKQLLKGNDPKKNSNILRYRQI